MSEQGQDQVQLTEEERLVGEVKTKLSELLRQDGSEITLADLGPSLHVEYSLDSPASIGDIEIGLYKDADARLVVNQKMNKSGPSGRLLAMVKILESDIETSSYTFIFTEGVTPSLQYKMAPESHKRFFTRKASEQELADLLQLLNQPFYLIDSPQ